MNIINAGLQKDAQRLVTNVVDMKNCNKPKFRGWTAKQCGNIVGRKKSLCKPTPRPLYPARSSAKENKGGRQKRKRARNQKIRRSSKTRSSNPKKRDYRTKRRRKKLCLGARRAARQCRSVSSSSFESDSSCSCKRPCRGLRREKADESCEASHSMSGSFQESIPASKHISPDASQLNPAFEQWNLNMPQAIHEALEATGFEPPGCVPVPKNPQEKPQGNNCQFQNACQGLL